jgi:hypothetical protein
VREVNYGYEDFEQILNSKGSTLVVKNVDLLYRLASKNLLEYLVKVSTDKFNPDKRVWLFLRDIAVQDEINDFYLNSKTKRQWRNFK